MADGSDEMSDATELPCGHLNFSNTKPTMREVCESHCLNSGHSGAQLSHAGLKEAASLAAAVFPQSTDRT